ncbi:hypothetical protein CR513_43128, partial [Mucuna pruriens]
MGPLSGTQNTDSQREEKLNLLEEHLRIIEGTNSHDLDVVDLCSIPDITLLTNFKTPKLEKYKGSSCPREDDILHSPGQDSNALLQDSLTGTALSWYVGLERGCVKTWRDLAEAFLRQYKYNEDMALDCS